MRKTKIAILSLILLIGGIVLTSFWMNLQGKKDSGEGESLAKIPHGEADMRLEKIRFVEDANGMAIVSYRKPHDSIAEEGR